MRKTMPPQLHYLQKPYKEILQRRITEFRHYLAGGNRQPTPMEIELLHMRIRNLVGSGTIYGHAAISKAARDIDLMLNSSTVDWNSAKLIGAFAKLIRVCETAVNAPDNDAPAPHSIHAQPADAVQTVKLPTILTVDDDPAIHELVRVLLGHNATILSAYNSDEAIKAAYSERPDLMLLDNYMPGMSGLAFLERFRENDAMPAIPVMMLTAEKQPHEKTRAATAGVVDYIVKPFEMEQFSERITGFLNRFRATVLVASDNAAERKRLARTLYQQGLDVVEAEDGMQVMAQAEQYSPDLVILDECMADATENATLRSLRSNHHTRSTPVLRLIVNQRHTKLPEDLRLGVTNQIVTPFLPQRIAARAMKILDPDIKYAQTADQHA